MSTSETLAEMLEKHRRSLGKTAHSRPRSQGPHSLQQLKKKLHVSPAGLSKVASGEFEKDLRRRLAETKTSNKHYQQLPQFAGVVKRLADGCGESADEWLKKLGFPRRVTPAGIPRKGKSDWELLVTKEMLASLSAEIGERSVPLEVFVGILRAKAMEHT